MNEYKELQAWIENNKAHLEGYTPEEIVQLAIAAGFSSMAAAQWKTQTAFKAAI